MSPTGNSSFGPSGARAGGHVSTLVSLSPEVRVCRNERVIAPPVHHLGGVERVVT